MKYQSTPWGCGPAALGNALEVLRTRVTQARLADLAGTTEAHGTDEEGLKRAILAVGASFDEVAWPDAGHAWAHLGYCLITGRPVVLCIDRWSHWVTAVGLCGKAILVFDPANTPLVAASNGLLVVNRDRFLRRWRAGHRTAKRLDQYYGLAVGD